jgi:hypothetical protein
VGARLFSALVICASLVAACSGSDNGSSRWDAAASAKVRALAKDLEARFPGECADAALLDRTVYVESAGKIGSPVPLAAGNCTVLGEDVETSVFADANHRSDFVNRRTDILCTHAAASKADLPGLQWVVAGEWSMQPDSAAAGRRVARAMRASSTFMRCPKR